MSAPQVSLVLATGGPSMVRAAYSSGHPALGVGAGNTPAVIDETADVQQAVSSILLSKASLCCVCFVVGSVQGWCRCGRQCSRQCPRLAVHGIILCLASTPLPLRLCCPRPQTFDNGVICASEQSVVVVSATACMQHACTGPRQPCSGRHDMGRCDAPGHRDPRASCGALAAWLGVRPFPLAPQCGVFKTLTPLAHPSPLQVDSQYDAVKYELTRRGAYILTPEQLDKARCKCPLLRARGCPPHCLLDRRF